MAMQTQVHEENGLYRLEYDAEIDSVVFTWKQFASGENFRSGAHAILEYFETLATNKFLVDTSGIQAHADEDSQWLDDVFYPKMIDAGMEYNAVVFPESAITQMDRDQIEKELDHHDYEGLWTADMDEARAFMANA